MMTDEQRTILLQAGNARFDGSDLTKYIEAIDEAFAVDAARYDAQVRSHYVVVEDAVLA